jgi:hypothetical protein
LLETVDAMVHRLTGLAFVGENSYKLDIPGKIRVAQSQGPAAMCIAEL